MSIFAILLNTVRIRGKNLEREDVVEVGSLAKLELLVPNMICEGCGEKITRALSALPGVRGVKSKVPQKHVTVRYEPAKVQEQQLRDAVARAGFTALEA